MEINVERERETKRVGKKTKGKRWLFFFFLRWGVGTESVRVIADSQY